MTGDQGLPRALEFEAFDASAGLAVVCGAISVVLPILTAGAATLTALGLASWVSLARRKGALVRGNLGTPATIALGILGGMAVAFLFPPPPLVPFRGLLLSCGLVPLVLVERRRSPHPIPTFGAT